jgi:hypothetical protein
MSSGVSFVFDELRVLLEVAANFDQRLSPVAAGAIGAGLHTFGERRRTSQNGAGHGGGEEGNGELHGDRQKRFNPLDRGVKKVMR